MKLLWLADVLRAAGQKVQEVPGWETRGRPYTYRPHAVLWHHTAGPEFESPTSRTPSLRIVIEGRAGIPGPLSQLYLAPDSVWYVVAAGYANHAGRGSYPGIDRGNPELLGIEVEESGDGDWIPDQLKALRVGTAAIMAHAGWDLMIGHKEWTDRKVDPAGLDMDYERRLVARMIEEVGMSIDHVDSAQQVQEAQDYLVEQGLLNEPRDNRADAAAGVSLLMIMLARVHEDIVGKLHRSGSEEVIEDLDEVTEAVIDEITTRMQNPD